MHTSPYVIPVYRGMTIVGTALSRDQQGDMVHTTVSDTTLSGSVELVYELRG